VTDDEIIGTMFDEVKTLTVRTVDDKRYVTDEETGPSAIGSRTSAENPRTIPLVSLPFRTPSNLYLAAYQCVVFSSARYLCISVIPPGRVQEHTSSLWEAQHE
jgi:hypothetical protein